MQPLSENEIRKVTHIAFCTLIHRMTLELDLPLQNLRLELVGEEEPSRESTRSHARSCTGILMAVQQGYNAVLKLRNFLGSCDHADQILERIPILLEQLDSTVFKPLRKASKGSKEEARRAISCVREAAKRLRDETSVESDSAQKLLTEAAQQLRCMAASSSQKRTCRMTVVSIDMSEYGRLARMLQEIASVEHLFQFNQELQAFFIDKIKEIKAEPDDVPAINTGDGALFFFPEPRHAVKFAQAVQLDASQRNRDAQTDDLKKCYRIGVCTGKVCMEESRSPDGKLLRFNVAGIAIARAVRLQARCQLDSVLICEDTHDLLPAKLRQRCGEARHFTGKRHENRKILARNFAP